MNADQNKHFCYRRSSAFIGGSLFFAPPPRDSVLTGARPGRSEQVSQSDSSAASTHCVDLRRSESRRGRHERHFPHQTEIAGMTSGDLMLDYIYTVVRISQPSDSGGAQE